jgi:hypothetical protein
MSLKPSTIEKLGPLWTKEARLRHRMRDIQRDLNGHPGNPSKNQSVSEDDLERYVKRLKEFDAVANDHIEVGREIFRVKSED